MFQDNEISANLSAQGVRRFACRPPVGQQVQWYNHEHRHSAIRFVTSAQCHEGIDISLLEKRAVVYEAAKQQRPDRWSGAT